MMENQEMIEKVAVEDQKSIERTLESTNPFKHDKRKCTDVMVLILFLFFWIGMLIIAGNGYRHGKPQRLLYGTDWMGRTCGASSDETKYVPAYDLTNYKYLLYPRLFDDMKALVAAGYDSQQLVHPSTFRKLFGVCVSACPVLSKKTLYVHAYIDYRIQGNPINEEEASAVKNEYLIAGSPWKVEMNTTNVLYRCVALTKVEVIQHVRCIDKCTDQEVERYQNGSVNTLTCGMDNEKNPFINCGAQSCNDVITAVRPSCKSSETMREEREIGTTIQDPVTQMISRRWFLLVRWLGDLQKAAVPVLICGGLIALILGFFWLLLLRYWASVFVMYFIVQDLNLHCIEWECRSKIIKRLIRIQLAIGIIREASKALQSMPMLTFYPFIPTFFAVILVAYWIVTATFIATSDHLVIPSTFPVNGTFLHYNDTTQVQIQEKKNRKYFMLYHLFGLLWTNQVIQAAAYTTIAGAFCEYYWTRNKQEIRRRPVLRSIWRTLRYHFGSIAFGSLILTWVQILRIICAYMDENLNRLKQINKVWKVVRMCLQVLLWCFENCLKFLNKNTFILIAMTGQSFGPAMKDSFLLLQTHAARIATVSILTRFLMLIGKVFVTTFSMLSMFLLIRYPPHEVPRFLVGDLANLTNPLLPMLLVGLLSYTTSCFFFDVYGTGIESILLCFCKDCHVNKTSQDFYMTKDLVAFLDGPAQSNAFTKYKNRIQCTDDQMIQKFHSIKIEN
ncbi:choline transporter-like protein [Plasmopara halstedii]|uniref:Choline transporter-like protein n=1 Tax=Plasmopara halstedii TaxID=4781 RepID=A0A0P1A4V1_PLAHL|nr:choline transporter-like protein [Plasmopara halstedii]CEG35148.1 choline transporter-like protein [Plasmopara halstedii]|eukprot:XP_024571517.1 choline transporter-like protein [Plasmopara halstedii]